ncbi:MAG TPA: alpha/beta hydrolase [Steroidobacteraceae bacterium]|nr:alpha/beta hydrolase [Steroidobacteraceae bacterium]
MATVVVIGAAVALLLGGLALFTALTARRAENLAPPAGRFAEVEGARLHYVDRGSGPVVVLVHGLSGNLRNFYALIDELAATCRVVAVDRPGCGYSRMIRGQHPELRAQARIIARFVHELRLDRPVLVGHSLGGALALALALEYPGCVSALVLISTLSHEERVPPAAFKALDIRSPTLQWLIAWTLVAPLGKLAQLARLEAVFAPERPPRSFVDDGGAALALRPVSFVAACNDLATVSDELATMIPRYPSVGIPVEVIFGRADPILDHRVHGERLVASLPNATLHLIAGGHMIPVTAADQIASRIRQVAERAHQFTSNFPLFLPSPSDQ